MIILNVKFRQREKKRICHMVHFLKVVNAPATTTETAPEIPDENVNKGKARLPLQPQLVPVPAPGPLVLAPMTPTPPSAKPTLVTVSPAKPTLVLSPTSPAKTTLSLVTPDGHKGKGRSVTDYQKLSHREQIYLRPDMYIGSDDKVPLEEWLFDLTTMKMVKQNITFPFAIRHLFLEGLCNATDNANFSRNDGIEPGDVRIFMDKRMISIRNGGHPIPVEIHPEHGIYGPELIFGTLLTSSNYKGVQTGIGKNGYGAKLINVFSKSFTVVVGDNIRHLKYTQTWSDNMQIRGEPQIEQYTGESYVQITYILDFLRFGYTEYPDEAFGLIARCATDASFTCKIPVVFNGITLSYPKITEYLALYFPPETNRLLHYEWPANTETVAGKNGLLTAKNPNAIPAIELCVIDTPHNGEVISFINGLMTKEGGVHVTAAMKTLTDGILSVLNFTKKEKKTKGKGKGKKGKAKAKGKEEKAPAKGKKGKGKEEKAVKLTVQDVRPHISVIVSCWVTNPKFTSQNKVNCTGPPVTYHIDPEFYNPICKWDLVDRLYLALEAKQFNKLTKTDGKKRRHISLSKGEDANLAGTPGYSRQCTLYVVEGKSAMGYAVSAISLVPNGRDYIGVYPMKGKPLNVMNAPIEQISQNDEINELKKMIGLKEGIDYSIEENFNTLRYGHFVILADSDDDGKHIIGLILNLFHCRFPSLLARGFVMFLRTPILRMTKGKTSVKFYTYSEYEAWKLATPDYRTWTPKYFKGLGTSKKEHVIDDFKTPRVVQCVYDDQSPASFRLAFDDKLADERKVWISTWQKLFEVEALQMQPISAFINHEFIQFSIADLHRSIPRMMDGLKVSQRKALWAMFQKWSQKGKPELGFVRTPKELKISQFANYIAEKSGYHHGEDCMQDTIMSMARDFVGTNNLPYFTRDGQFGTRNLGGEDAASGRYPFTRPEWWLSYVFKKEDVALLQSVEDEGHLYEPVSYLPILPMHLINGSYGIGTGHSTFIPNHNPLDICEWIKARIRGVPVPTIVPWYRDFKGDIEITVRPYRPPRKRGPPAPAVVLEAITDAIPDANPERIEKHLRLIIENEDRDDDEDDDEETPETDGTDTEKKKSPILKIMGEQATDPLGPPRLSMVTRGRFQQGNNNSVIVTELPISRWTHKYYEWLGLLHEDKEITDYKNLSTDTDVLFEIYGFKDPTHKKLRLEKSFGMTNMVLLDMNNAPVKYDSVPEILEAFYQGRLPYYERRRQMIIDTIATDILKRQHKIRFIRAIIDKEIEVMGRKKAMVLPRMQELGLPPELLTNTRISNCTEEEIQSLQDEIDQLNVRRQSYINTSATILWLADLDEFENAYCRYYKCPLPGGRALAPMLIVAEPEGEAKEEINDD